MERQKRSRPAPLIIGEGDGHEPILRKIRELYQDLFLHNGFGELRVGMRFLKKGQKEIVVSCGKEFRYVVDYPDAGVPRP